MTSPPLVTVVIPAHNAEAFVGEAIQSVLGQDYERRECIVVDDGSTDGTASVVGGFGNDVRLVQTSNRGVAAARNTGAEAGEGELIAFLDADDVWLPSKLSQQVALFDAPSVVLAYGGVELVDAAGRHLGWMAAPDPRFAVERTVCLRPPPIALAQTGVVRRAAFCEVNGFDERLSTSADCDLVARLGARGEVARVASTVARYRQHPSQMRHDLDLFEHDMRLVFEKAFGTGTPPWATPQTRFRARASFHRTLALSHRHTRRLDLVASHSATWIWNSARAFLASRARAGS